MDTQQADLPNRTVMLLLLLTIVFMLWSSVVFITSISTAAPHYSNNLESGARIGFSIEDPATRFDSGSATAGFVLGAPQG